MSTDIDRLREAVAHDLAILTRDLVTPAEDPLVRERAMVQAIDTVVDLQSSYAKLRQATVAEMRKTRSARELAAELGISRARIYQILREA